MILPACRLVWRSRPPVGEFETLDAADEFGFDRLGLRRSRAFVTARGPAQDKAFLIELESNIGATGGAESGWQIADKC